MTGLPVSEGAAAGVGRSLDREVVRASRIFTVIQYQMSESARCSTKWDESSHLQRNHGKIAVDASVTQLLIFSQTPHRARIYFRVKRLFQGVSVTVYVFVLHMHEDLGVVPSQRQGSVMTTSGPY